MMTDTEWSEIEEMKIELLHTIAHYIKSKIPRCVLPESEESWVADDQTVTPIHNIIFQIDNMKYYLKVAHLIVCERQEYPFAECQINFEELGDPKIFDRIIDFLNNPDQRRLGESNTPIGSGKRI